MNKLKKLKQEIEEELENLIQKKLNDSREYFIKSNFDKKNWRKIVLEDLKGDWIYELIRAKRKTFEQMVEIFKDMIDNYPFSYGFTNEVRKDLKEELSA